MNMKVFLGIVVILAVLFGAYIYAQPEPATNLVPPTQSTSTPPVHNTPTPPRDIEPAGNSGNGNGEEGTTMAFSGTLTCLPHKGTGPHTMECAYGLKADDGSYYALQNLWEVNSSLTETGTRIRVEGAVSDPENTEKYDIKGVIWVVGAVKI
ncbi:hypothetical protein KW798_01220 [Candidatus Parcubacteria bacterium]|nr:hypothetical protein [Candidatus Parcubacteria bacterium]